MEGGRAIVRLYEINAAMTCYTEDQKERNLSSACHVMAALLLNIEVNYE